MGWFTKDKDLADIVAPVPKIISDLKAFSDKARADAAADRKEADDVVRAASATAAGLNDSATQLENEAASADKVSASLSAVTLDA